MGLRIVLLLTFSKLRARTHFRAGEDRFIVRESGGDWRKGFDAGCGDGSNPRPSGCSCSRRSSGARDGADAGLR